MGAIVGSCDGEVGARIHLPSRRSATARSSIKSGTEGGNTLDHYQAGRNTAAEDGLAYAKPAGSLKTRDQTVSFAGVKGESDSQELPSWLEVDEEGNYSFKGGDGNDNFSAELSEDGEWITFSMNGQSVKVSAANVKSVEVDLGAGSDKVRFGDNMDCIERGIICKTGGGDDTITAGSNIGSFSVDSGPGNDTVTKQEDEDTLLDLRSIIEQEPLAEGDENDALIEANTEKNGDEKDKGTGILASEDLGDALKVRVDETSIADPNGTEEQVRKPAEESNLNSEFKEVVAEQTDNLIQKLLREG